jgi:hypothetical protein
VLFAVSCGTWADNGDAAKAFVNMLAKGDFKTAVDTYFDGTMHNALPADKLQQAWQSVDQQAGGFLNIDGVRHDIRPKFDIEYVACKFAHGVSDVKVVFNGSHQVSGLWFVPHMEKPATGKPTVLVNNADAAKAFVNMLASKDFKKAVDTYFDSIMRGALPADKLQQTWAAHEQATGGFLNIDGVRHDTKGGFDVEFVACKFARCIGDVEVVFNGVHQISGLWFVPHTEKPAVSNAGAARTFVNMLAKNDFKRAVDTYFDSVMRGALPADKLEQTWTALGQQVGGFVKIDGVRTNTAVGYDVEYVACSFANAVIDVKVVFNDDHQITGLWLVPHADH